MIKMGKQVCESLEPRSPDEVSLGSKSQTPQGGVMVYLRERYLVGIQLIFISELNQSQES